MIKLPEIAEAGLFNKPHGIKGEISATLDIDIELNDVRCIIIAIDGIFVPFFLTSVRPKNADTFLLSIDGIDTEEKAQRLTNKPFFVLRSDLPEDDASEDGMYASDFIGYKVIDRTIGEIGEIVDINDTTQNVLFIVRTHNGQEIFLPVVDEFIDSFDTEKKILETNLPEGLVDLNN